MILNKVFKALLGILVSLNIYGQVDTAFIQQMFSSSDLVNQSPIVESKVYAAGRILEDQKEICF